MTTTFVYTPVRVKQEKPDPPVTVTRLGPDAPWAMQEVAVKKEDGGQGEVLRVEPVRRPREFPWSLVPPAKPRIKELRRRSESPDDEKPEKPRKERRRSESPDDEKPEKPKKKKEGARQVSTQNYAAIEAGAERYGLIDMGPADAGRRSLVVHARKSNKTPHTVLNAIRPGSVLFVKRGRRVGRTMQLRVRFTTPARYYSPGAKLSTLAIAVDETDWQSLVADAPHI